MNDSLKNQQNNIVHPFQSLCGHEEMFSKIIEYFPYPIHVYAPDGTMILTNGACLEIMHISSKDKIVGKFNVLQDPIIDKWGENVRAQIARSFQGEIVQFHNLKMPIQGIIDRFGKEELCFDISFQNITCFPIYNDNRQLAYVVNVFITSNMYSGKEEMVKAKEYMESHWLEEFDIDKIANAVNLSRYHFTRLFKKHTFMTPYSYYQDIKVKRLKEKLCDKNISIKQAFAACGIDYSGNYARIFKERVGMTPSQYRETV
ncbi:MAG TPA: helix-turn-helix transcriptional regulator [Syntrophomonadaceae bacterium]|nr:helix-turn-helix transcriptional regulator [Syntrophomonadaceae bacterium]